MDSIVCVVTLFIFAHVKLQHRFIHESQSLCGLSSWAGSVIVKNVVHSLYTNYEQFNIFLTYLYLRYNGSYVIDVIYKDSYGE